MTTAVQQSPAYVATLATMQAYTALQQAAQEALSGVTNTAITITSIERRSVTAADLARGLRNVYAELQFERPIDVHHSIVLFADASELAALFALEPVEGEDANLNAESLLGLGDIASSCVDTLASALTWLTPTPRAWLANLEPIAFDPTGSPQWSLPPLLAKGEPLYQIAIALAADGAPVCTLQALLAESGERAMLGLDAQNVVGSATGQAAHRQSAGAQASPVTAMPPSSAQVQAAQFSPLGPNQTASRGNGIDLIRDVPLKITVELGRASLTVREVLALGSGSVVELDRLAGEPIDVLVNDRLIAHGEVVIVDESFGVRITDLLQQPQ